MLQRLFSVHYTLIHKMKNTTYIMMLIVVVVYADLQVQLCLMQYAYNKSRT